MTNNLVKFFQTSPKASSGDLLDLITWNNNVGQWGKLGYFESIINSSQQRISLTFSNSILNATLTTVIWTTATIPNQSMWTSGTNIFIPEDGKYIFDFEMAVPGSTAGLRQANFQLNGVSYYFNQYMDAVISTNVQSVFVQECVAGDIVTIAIRQDSTATRTVTGSLYVQKFPEIKD